MIGEKKKDIEVRKSALKDLPQDIVFYMSKDEKSFAKIPKEFQEKYRKHFGKVGIRAVVDNMDVYAYDCCDGVDIDDDMLLETMIDREYINIYAKGKPLYGWHLDNVAIYDKPKELSEFRPICKFEGKDLICNLCPNHEYNGGLFFECRRKVTRPPQSYMRVKELKEV